MRRARVPLPGRAMGHLRSSCGTLRIEQVFEVTRLTAKILIRRPGLGTERCRRVPWPSRIVEHRTRERDRIRLPVSNDGLCLRGLRDQAHGDDGNPHIRLYPLRKRYLITRRRYQRLLWRDPATRHMHGRAAMKLKGPG